MTARYSIYFSPTDASALGRFGSSVLGRDGNSFKDRVPATDIEPFTDTDLWQSYTQKPAHYGFHATIKAPFELAPDCTAAELLEELSAFCASRSDMALPGLRPARLQKFTALTMPVQPPELIALAADVVTHFEPFRRELSAADIKRRNPEKLTAGQRENLEQFGYPYIFDDFQFHMTLSDALPDAENRYLPWVESIYRQLVRDTVNLDRLCVFRQVDRDTPFLRIAEFPLKTGD